MNATRQIAYRLKAEGKAEVVRDAADVGKALRDSYAQAEAGANAAGSAADRQQAKFARMAEAARASAAASQSQGRYNAALGVRDMDAGAARDSAAVFMAEAEAMEDAERRAKALRAILDPLGAAQDRLNDELNEYQRLASVGAISSKELAEGQALARRKFDETTASIGRQQQGLSRLVVASRLNLARQGADVMVTAAMGMNPAMIAMQQGPQILDAMATSGIKLTGTMVGLGLAAGVTAGTVLALGAAWHSGEAASLDLERAVSGLGRTAGLTARDLEVLTVRAADQGKVTVSSAREQAVAYLNTGRIGREQIAGLIAIGRDYASVMGMDAEEATKSLAQAMLAPDKAARALTATMGLLDQKTLAQIDSMVKQGDLMSAQQLLIDALNGKLKGHADQLGEVETAWEGIARWASKAWHEVGTYLHITEDERFNKLVSARAGMERRGGPQSPSERTVYDEWGRQAWEIQGRRSRREAQAEGSAENQAAELAWERAREAAKHKGRQDHSAEREARERLARDRREEDRQAMLDMEVARATNDYAAIARLEQTNAVRERERQLIDDGVSAEKAKSKALEEQARLSEAREVQVEREKTALFRTADIEANRLEGQNRFVAARERQVELDERIARYATLFRDTQVATAVATQEQLMLDEARAEAQERILLNAERERQIALARARGDDRTAGRLQRDSDIDARAREIEAARHWNRGEGDKQAAVEWKENWLAEAEGARRSWAKGFAADIRSSRIKEALSNQLNRAVDDMLSKMIDALFDIDWSAIFNQGGGMAGQGGGLGGIVSGIGNWLMGGIGRNAAGTDYWRGGWTWVGEEGPELIRAPRGAQVLSNTRSMQMAAMQGGTGGGTVNHYYLQGAVTTDELWTRIDRGDRMAAHAGANQGASLAVGVVRSTATAEQHAQRMSKL